MQSNYISHRRPPRMYIRAKITLTYPVESAVAKKKWPPVGDVEDNVPIRISQISPSWNSHYLEYPAGAYNFQNSGRARSRWRSIQMWHLCGLARLEDTEPIHGGLYHEGYFVALSYSNDIIIVIIITAVQSVFPYIVAFKCTSLSLFLCLSL